MDGDACELTLTFDTPQDLSEMRVALWKGDQRTRSIDVLVDGALDGTFVSSGTTTDYETYDLVVAQVNEVVLQAVDIADNGWLSVTGVSETSVTIFHYSHAVRAMYRVSHLSVSVL